jgi:hypothetical protein
MMNANHSLFLPWIAALLTVAATAPVARAQAEPAPLTMKVVRQGLIEGYPAGAKTKDKKTGEEKTAYFESSAVATDGKSVWFIGDKPGPAMLSSVVKVPLAQLKEKSVVPFADVQPVTGTPLEKMQKIESTTVAEEGIRFASTAFDRFEAESNKYDASNIIVAWRGMDMDKAAVLNPKTLDGVTSSMALRTPLRAALKETQWPKGPRYIKIEGLAALPGKRLWFGIRESGTDGESAAGFSYHFTVLETKWEEKDGSIRIVPEFRKVFDATPEQLTSAGVTGTVGISSLEYDPHRGIVWAVASWEEETLDGSWLLALTLPAAEEAPRLLPVHGADGKPVAFTHKVEGLCVVDDHTLLLASDEDRRLTVIQTPDGPKTREPHMGVWTLLETAGR